MSEDGFIALGTNDAENKARGLGFMDELRCQLRDIGRFQEEDLSFINDINDTHHFFEQIDQELQQGIMIMFHFMFPPGCAIDGGIDVLMVLNAARKIIVSKMRPIRGLFLHNPFRLAQCSFDVKSSLEGLPGPPPKCCFASSVCTDTATSSESPPSSPSPFRAIMDAEANAHASDGKSDALNARVRGALALFHLVHPEPVQATRRGAISFTVVLGPPPAAQTPPRNAEAVEDVHRSRQRRLARSAHERRRRASRRAVDDGLEGSSLVETPSSRNIRGRRLAASANDARQRNRAQGRARQARTPYRPPRTSRLGPLSPAFAEAHNLVFSSSE